MLFRRVTMELLGDSAAGGACSVPPGHVTPQRASNFSREFICNMRRVLMLKVPTEVCLQESFRLYVSCTLFSAATFGRRHFNVAVKSFLWPRTKQ